MSDKIIVLGKEFTSDEERREYFREELRKKLPELKSMEGFPIGDDDDIINLSDPPYYTACPNPWLDEWIRSWEKNKEELKQKGLRTEYNNVKPYATDISEGRHTWLYKAHTYHTKVPPVAIKKFIEHYTQPGDIVYDGFAGSGMTGLAAMLPDLNRNTIINDISPIASFITHMYSCKIDPLKYRERINELISITEKELGWMYFKKSLKQKVKYYVWSDVFLCETCGEEIVFWDAAFNKETKKFNQEFCCDKCGTKTSKKDADRVKETVYDRYLNKTVSRYKQVPVIVASSTQGSSRLVRSEFDSEDKTTLEKVLVYNSSEKYTDLTRKMLFRDGQWGDQWKNCMHLRPITHVHQFFSDRQFLYLQKILNSLDYKDHIDKAILFTLTSVLQKCSKLMVYNADGIGRVQKGTLYISSVWQEMNICHMLKISSEDMLRAVKEGMWRDLPSGNEKTQTSQINWSGSTLSIPLKNDSVDYIFTDPPFGANIPYSEVNFIWESIIKVFTPLSSDVVQSKIQNKDENDYHKLMHESFKELFRILKPGKWMTVEFSNTRASIWNGIQNALTNAGFVIAYVAGLDKKQGSFKSVTTVTAVKQDLVISCYKPSSKFDDKFKLTSNLDIGVWDFVEEHLNHLPIHLIKGNATTAIVERSPKILFDRLIAFYVQKNLPVPIDAGVFQNGLRERFLERDGMFFTNEQVQEYDKKKKETPEFIQLSIVVSSEQDGVLWLKDLLESKPMKYQDINPEWMQAIAGIRKGDVLPELATILEENFLEDGGKWYVPDPENEADLDKLRSKRLLKQFDEYKEEAFRPKGKIKEARVEALRAGFKQCYQDKDFKSIVQIGDRIPNNLLMEDEVLLQFYDIASSRV